MFIAGLYYVERHHDLEQFGSNDKIPDLKADQPKEGTLFVPSILLPPSVQALA